MADINDLFTIISVIVGLTSLGLSFYIYLTRVNGPEIKFPSPVVTGPTVGDQTIYLLDVVITNIGDRSTFLYIYYPEIEGSHSKKRQKINEIKLYEDRQAGVFEPLFYPIRLSLNPGEIRELRIKVNIGRKVENDEEIPIYMIFFYSDRSGNFRLSESTIQIKNP